MGRMPHTMRLHFVAETSPLGTGDAIRNTLNQTQGSPIMVMNGNSYVDCPLEGLYQFHSERGAAASMLLVEVTDAGRYGTVQTNLAGEVSSFAEKSENSDETSWINAGIYVFDRHILEQIPENSTVSLEYDILPPLCDFGLYGYRQHARFIDIGTPKTLVEADEFFASVQLGDT